MIFSRDNHSNKTKPCSSCWTSVTRTRQKNLSKIPSHQRNLIHMTTCTNSRPERAGTNCYDFMGLGQVWDLVRRSPVRLWQSRARCWIDLPQWRSSCGGVGGSSNHAKLEHKTAPSTVWLGLSNGWWRRNAMERKIKEWNCFRFWRRAQVGARPGQDCVLQQVQHGRSNQLKDKVIPYTQREWRMTTDWTEKWKIKTKCTKWPLVRES